MNIQGLPRHFVRSFIYWAAIVAVLCTAAQAPVLAAPPADSQGLKPILTYISTAWDTLTRSMTDCQSIVDPKISTASVLYLPMGFSEPESVKSLTSHCNVRVEHLPIEIHRLGEIDTSRISPPGYAR